MRVVIRHGYIHCASCDTRIQADTCPKCGPAKTCPVCDGIQLTEDGDCLICGYMVEEEDDMTEKTAGKVRIGDRVNWRGGWGSDPATPARVTGLELTEPGEKEGDPVSEASWELCAQDRVLFTLDNSHWAYGTQISPLQEETVTGKERTEVHKFTKAQLEQIAMQHAKLAIVGRIFHGEIFDQTVSTDAEGSLLVYTRLRQDR